jgi:hypothetical protein
MSTRCCSLFGSRLLLVFSLFCLQGCVATAAGVVVGTTVAVGTAVVKAPIKVGAAVVGVMTDDEDEKSNKKN